MSSGYLVRLIAATVASGALVYLTGPQHVGNESRRLVGGFCSWASLPTPTNPCPGGCNDVDYHVQPPAGYGYDWNGLQGICGSASGCINYVDWQNNGTENCEPGGP